MFIFITNGNEGKERWYNINHIAMIDTYTEHPSGKTIIRVTFTDASGLQPIGVSQEIFQQIMNITQN